MCKFLQTLLGNELTLEIQLKQEIQFCLLFCYVAANVKNMLSAIHILPVDSQKKKKKREK